MDIVLQICIPGAQGRVGEDETRIWRWNSPAVQWLGLRAASTGGTDSIPGQRTGIPYAEWCSQKKKKPIWRGKPKHGLVDVKLNIFQSNHIDFHLLAWPDFSSGFLSYFVIPDSTALALWVHI